MAKDEAWPGVPALPPKRGDRVKRSKADEPVVVAAQGPEPPPEENARTPSPRQRQIYQQASRLFVEKGYDATSMSDIAEAVNITKAGLYHFVTGKEELLFTIMNFGMDAHYKQVVEPARAVADPLERLQLIIRNHVRNVGGGFSPDGNPVTVVTNEPSGLTPEHRKLINARHRAYFDLLKETLVELKRRGDMSEELDPSVAAHTIIGMILWMSRWRRREGPLALEALADHITRQALVGIQLRAKG